jgi:hypothetical protein
MFENIDLITNFSPVFELPGTEPAIHSTRFSGMHPFDTYHWEKVSGPTCIDGQLQETWCYIECAGGRCQPLWCEDRIAGPC